jgi:hypothetical protein
MIYQISRGRIEAKLRNSGVVMVPEEPLRAPAP